MDGSEGFSYFHMKFGVPYRFFLKKSIECDHILAVVVKSGKLIAFARFELLEKGMWKSRNGMDFCVQHPLHLLRSIEVHSSFRGAGIGRVLLACVIPSLGGYVITKPDNPKAQKFFMNIFGFRHIQNSPSPFDMTKYPNHVILPYPVAKHLFTIVAEKYPYLFASDLLIHYERLKYCVKHRKLLLEEDIELFGSLFERRREMLPAAKLVEIEAFQDALVHKKV